MYELWRVLFLWSKTMRLLRLTFCPAAFRYSGRALRIGVTGAPGAGKSTIVDKLARHYRGAGVTVGVIAVDPTSPFTGGAILGDRIRMQENLERHGVLRAQHGHARIAGWACTDDC